ncbi:hypothetical protein GGR34_003334 [Microvirga flocculans]|uniref:Uncharacterized protein n=1 Tax=Microvirga flocculans TaxID=217168 RepID=A0A7W6N9F3_9HYPH|nr:hypothetical protein [Microvirga flocculans]MBB4041656.1 hypothetical protein [Microvirga flocculans]
MPDPQSYPAANPTYERRLVVFIDFLGFKEIVERTTHDPDYLGEILRAMDVLGEIGMEPEIFGSQRLTQFSDSIVLSYRIDEESAVFWLLSQISLAVIGLVERGFLIRGAVTVGDLYHHDRHVVGPAMVRAYEMESKKAKHPRVIIDPEVVRVARQSHAIGHAPDEEEEYVRAFITKDLDGLFFLDYVSWKSVIEVAGGNDKRYPKYLEKLARLIEQGLQHDNAGVAEKYLWLHRQYVDALDLIRTLPADNGYRLENPENCTAIEAMPDMDELAETTKERVAAARKSKWAIFRHLVRSWFRRWLPTARRPDDGQSP